MSANGSVAFTFPDELIEQIAERAAELVAQRSVSPAGQSADGWVRGAKAIGEYVDAPHSRIYALASAKRIPVHRDGSALIARRSELDAWVRNGGGRRP